MKYKYKNEFYEKVWILADRDLTKVPATIERINNKINELCGLVSRFGAVEILMENKKK